MTYDTFPRPNFQKLIDQGRAEASPGSWVTANFVDLADVESPARGAAAAVLGPAGVPQAVRMPYPQAAPTTARHSAKLISTDTAGSRAGSMKSAKTHAEAARCRVPTLGN